MQKQISSTRHTNHAKRWAENCTGMWSRGLRNQNRKLLINLCKANVVETQPILPNHPFPIALWWVISMFMLLALSTGNEVLANSLYNELTITLFSVESLNNINIEITHHRVIGDGCIWERIFAQWFSVLSSSKYNQWWCFRRKCLTEK